MFLLTFTLFFVLIIYLLPPLFLIHILWLLATTALTGRRLTEIIHGVVVMKEDCYLPQPPGFFSLESRSDSLTKECTFTDSSSISSDSEHIDKYPMGDDPVSPPLADVCVMDRFQTCSREDIAKKPSIYIFPDDTSDSPPLTRRPSRKFLTSFRKLSSPTRVRRDSTLSKSSGSFFKRLSGSWSKPKRCKRQKDDTNHLPRTIDRARTSSSPSWLRTIKLIIYPPDASSRLYIRELHVQSASYS